MRPLLWKEWHEQRWKLGFGCVVLCAFVLIGLRSRMVPDQSIIIGACALGVLLLPILSAAGLFPAERGEGTLKTLLALPVARSQILAAKLLVGMALCAAPLLATAATSLAVAGGREISNSAILVISGRAVAVAVFLFVWMFALTVRSPSEGRGAALALGILVCWLIVTSGLVRAGNLPRDGLTTSDPAFRSWLVCPFLFVLPTTLSATALGFLTQCAISLVLCLLTVRAMKVTNSEVRP